MPRKRTEHISETLEELKKLEAEYGGKPEAERITFLRILKENPGYTHAEAAKVLGRSEPTVQRWWRAYKLGGVGGAVDVRKSGGRKPARLSDEGVEALRRKVLREGVRDIRTLQAWLRERYGVEYSRAGVQYLLRAKVGMERGGAHNPVEEPEPHGRPAAAPTGDSVAHGEMANGAAVPLNGATQNGTRNGAQAAGGHHHGAQLNGAQSGALPGGMSVGIPGGMSGGKPVSMPGAGSGHVGEDREPGMPAGDEELLIPEFVIRILNTIPTTHEVKDWIPGFKQSLQTFLGDVDRISIVVNIDCDLRNPETYRRDISVTQVRQNGPLRGNTIVVAERKPGESPVEELLDSLRHQNFPFETYYRPTIFEFYLVKNAFLGAIFLWRERVHPPISARTVNTIEAMKPFLIFIMSDVVARHKYSFTVDVAFNEALAFMLEEAGLTERERQVVILQLFGHTYDQIAERLYVSIDTVRKYVTSIYRKTGTHSYTELFAKYFTPSLTF